ncbi:MAG: hypothetical protein JXA46_10865 [Dehalococcoidales bacterium]|nr:hypothetical protein [Dehalococcoidales bacterium]
MENTFDSTYVINKEKYDEFIKDSSKVAIAAYTIPLFTALDIYSLVDISTDIAVRVVWKPETTVAQIKEFDKVWFLQKYD